jgi:tRNA threonylcarbamoyladenosine biosynthesis protein TsaB
MATSAACGRAPGVWILTKRAGSSEHACSVKILAVDTALGACSVAVLSGDRVLAEEYETMLRGHAEALAPMAQRAMGIAGIPFSALERIGVTTGPGTFTGQRVGLAFARALAVALKIPVVGTTTLHAMAEAALAVSPNAAWAVTAADAKRGEVYLAAYARRGTTLIEPRLVLASEVISPLSRTADEHGLSPVLAGTATPLITPILTHARYQTSDSGVRQPNAVFVGRLAAKSADIGPPRPLYLRAPDAKLPVSR